MVAQPTGFFQHLFYNAYEYSLGLLHSSETNKQPYTCLFIYAYIYITEINSQKWNHQVKREIHLKLFNIDKGKSQLCFSLSHTLYPVNQQMLLTLFSKYIQGLTTSYHLHFYYHSCSRHLLSLGFFFRNLLLVSLFQLLTLQHRSKSNPFKT